MHVLRNVHGALVRRGLALNVHPLGLDFAVHAGARGLGFVDASRFARIVQAMDEVVARSIEEGLFEELESIRRHVAERFDAAAEALEQADEWTNLRMPGAVRRRLREVADGPVEFVEAIRYRLLRKRAARSRR